MIRRKIKKQRHKRSQMPSSDHEANYNSKANRIYNKNIDIVQCKYSSYLNILKHSTSTYDETRLQITEQYMITELDTG
jgi:hypothetical protein